jgi:4-amino-4-deoxy-L-arabinose transferase-like glycosyltransferase
MSCASPGPYSSPPRGPKLSWAANWPRIALLVLVVLTASVLLPGNSDLRALDWHEILVAETASEMLQRNEFLVPHIADEPRLKKPPLNYWLALAAHRLLGEPGTSHVSEFEARLPSLISGLLLLVVTYGLGLQLTRDPRGGLMAAAFIASSLSFHTFSRSARPEMLYTLLCALMAFGLIWAVRRAADGRSTVAAAILAWAAFGLALMTKGPQFPLLILLGVVLALLMLRPGLPLLKTLHPWMALPAMVLPLAYYGYIALQFDAALALWGSEMVQGDDVPLWYRPLRFYYPLILVASLAPWMIAVGKSAVDVWKNREPAALVLASCVLVALVLVSFSGKLRGHYVLPLLPLCTALMAWSILRTFDSVSGINARQRRFKLLVWSQFALAGVITAGAIVVQVFAMPGSDPGIFISYALPMLLMAGASYVVAIVMVKRNLAAAFAALVGAVLLASGAYPWIGGWQSGFAQSTREFIQEVEASLPADGVLHLDQGKHMLHFDYYYGKGDLAVFSLERWQKSAGPDPAPYFITNLARIKDSGIDGKIIFKQQSDEADTGDTRVLFQPTPHT